MNEKERDWGTDPTDPDTDNDNLSDYQEVTWKKSDPLDSDTDNDGLNDFNEFLKGTNPRVPDPNNYSSTPKNP